jgi:tetratricopeptide (TPR) repeat protein
MGPYWEGLFMKKSFIILLSLFLVSFFCASAFSASSKDYYDYGKKLMDKGDYKNALKYFSAAAKGEPKNPEYYNAIGDCFEATGNTAAAKKYHDYADKLSGGKTTDGQKGNEVKMEVIIFSGGMSSSGGDAFVPVFAASYERYLGPNLSISGSIGYVYGGSQSAGVSGDEITLSGGGFMVQGKLNWHLDEIKKGLFAGPNLAFMPISYQYKETTTDYYYGTATTTTYNLGDTLIMGGVQVGYTYKLNDQFNLTGFCCLDLASESLSGDAGFGNMKASSIGFLQFYGISGGMMF